MTTAAVSKIPKSPFNWIDDSPCETKTTWLPTFAFISIATEALVTNTPEAAGGVYTGRVTMATTVVTDALVDICDMHSINTALLWFTKKTKLSAV